MRFYLIAVGSPRDKAIAAAIADYEIRASRYWPLEVIEVKHSRGDDANTIKAMEAESIRARLPLGKLVACDENGRAFTSPAFAAWLQDARERAGEVAFVIGGAFGLHPTLLSKADLQLALAPWTLSHELARLILAEQLYRAGTIVRGEPYHK